MPTTNDPYFNLFGRPVKRTPPPPTNAEGPASPKTPADQSSPDSDNTTIGDLIGDKSGDSAAEHLVSAACFMDAAKRFLVSDKEIADQVAEDISFDQAFSELADYLSHLDLTSADRSRNDYSQPPPIDYVNRRPNPKQARQSDFPENLFAGSIKFPVAHGNKPTMAGVDLGKMESPTRCPAGRHKWGPWHLVHPGILQNLGPRYFKFQVQSSTCTKCSAIRVRKHRVYRPFIEEFSTRLPLVDRDWLRIPAAILIFPLHLLVHLIVSVLACIISTVQDCRGIDTKY